MIINRKIWFSLILVLYSMLSGCKVEDNLENYGSDNSSVGVAQNGDDNILPSINLETHTPIPNNGGSVNLFNECIDTFEAFAYTVPEEEIKEVILPLSPWQYVTDLPPTNYGNNRRYPATKILTDLWVNGIQEIWILSEEYIDVGTFSEIEIYYPELDEWERISPYIGETTFYVNQLFIPPDGTIFGIVTWFPSGGADNGETTVLTKFNPITNKFEVIPELSELTLKIPLSSLGDIGPVLMDELGNFWIFQNNDGLYHLNSTTFEITQAITFPGRVVDETISYDGSIFFGLHALDKIYFGFGAGELFQFVPDTGELYPLNPPTDEKWPSFSGLLVDSQNRLWLGSVGWLDNDGHWNLLHPDFEGWAHVMPDTRWVTPKIVYESSDGRLWFYKYTERWYAGTVWYDPQTGDGCWFTNRNGLVYEDANRQLWITVDNKLFKLDLAE